MFLALVVLDIARGVWGESPYSEFGPRLAFGLGMAIHDLLRLALTTLFILVVSGVAYLFLMRRQGVAFRKAMFNWPVVALVGGVALLLLFVDI